eukprot:5867580-Amphidinium_carterae.1
MKILLEQLDRLQGAVRDHLLLNTDLQNPDYDKAMKTVEDCYRNVYIDNEQDDLKFKGANTKQKAKGSKGMSKQEKNYNNYDNYGKRKGKCINIIID